MSNFFGNGARDQDKIPLLAWENIFRAKKDGRVGLRDWNIMN